MSPATSVAVGFVLVLAGFLAPFLMVLQVLESGLVLSVSAYFSSLVGLLLALYGISQHVSLRRRDAMRDPIPPRPMKPMSILHRPSRQRCKYLLRHPCSEQAG